MATWIETIMCKAFPALHAVVNTSQETLPEAEVRGALREEMDSLVKASWQHQQTKRRPDRDSRVAAMMGTAPRLVAHWTKQAATAEARAPSRRLGNRAPRKASAEEAAIEEVAKKRKIVARVHEIDHQRSGIDRATRGESCGAVSPRSFV